MTTLKEKYKDYFKVGVCVNARTIHSHRDIITKHFNSITCENEMKFSNVTVDVNEYDFTISDQIVDFARNHNLDVRGHTLVWHNQTPNWVFSDANREILLERMESHMNQIAKRYEKDIYCWDVVNEAIDDKHDLFYRESKWSQIIGESYIEEAFCMTHEILPKTKLFYNDYNETTKVKREKIFELLKRLRERDVPIDGMGMQCHTNIYENNTDDLKRSIELYGSLGLEIQVTEMDVSMYDFHDKTILEEPTKEMLEMQAKVYDSYFRVFREYKDIITGVTLWGVADDRTWLDYFPVANRKNWPLLFDMNHEPKEAFYRLMEF